jgi:hypothetical protein
MVDPKDDPELEEDDKSGTDSTREGMDHPTALRVDGYAKWTAGLAKELLYLQWQLEYCGGYLGSFILGTRFSRLLVVEDKHVVTEATPSSINNLRDRMRGTTISGRIGPFLHDQSNISHLAWDLSTADDQWQRTAVDRLVQLHRVSVDIIKAHVSANPTAPFCRISPLQ